MTSIHAECSATCVALCHGNKATYSIMVGFRCIDSRQFFAFSNGRLILISFVLVRMATAPAGYFDGHCWWPALPHSRCRLTFNGDILLPHSKFLLTNVFTVAKKTTHLETTHLLFPVENLQLSSGKKYSSVHELLVVLGCFLCGHCDVQLKSYTITVPISFALTMWSTGQISTIVSNNVMNLEFGCYSQHGEHATAAQLTAWLCAPERCCIVLLTLLSS